MKSRCLESTLKFSQLAQGTEIEDYFIPLYKDLDDRNIQRIAISACHGIGKTFTLGDISCALMSTHTKTKLISTAPTFRQVHDLLWKEISSAYNRLFPKFRRGRLNEVSWWIDDDTFARGFSPQRSAQKETGQGTESNFVGYHPKNMMIVIFDEATGVRPEIWKQVEGLLTSGRRVLFIVIANPTSRNCNFFKCFSNPAWKTYTITCFDTPNLKASNIKNVKDIEKEVDEIRRLRTIDPTLALEKLSSYPTPKPHLINTRWVIEKAIEWGVTHPLFLGKVIGQFPESDSNSIISEEEVKVSQARNVNIEGETIAYGGLDVARFGEDKSVLTLIIGNKQIKFKRMDNFDTNQVVGETINFLESVFKEYPEIEKLRLAVDGGFGHGVIDNLREKKGEESNKRVFAILKNVEILEINFGGADWVKYHYGWADEATRKKKEKDKKVQEDRENYANYKAKMFDLLGIDIRARLQLINDEIYFNQLPSIIRLPDGSGRLKIESKEDYKVRTGETSPDEADSLALANFAKYYSIKRVNVIFEAMLNYE